MQDRRTTRRELHCQSSPLAVKLDSDNLMEGRYILERWDETNVRAEELKQATEGKTQQATIILKTLKKGVESGT